MLKQITTRFLNGFCFSIAITMCVQLILMLSTGTIPMLPEFVAGFDNEVIAFAVQLVMVGLMSGVTSAGTVVFEMKKTGMLLQSVYFLLIMLSAWIPVACIAWGFHKYRASMITTTISIVLTYGICRAAHYFACRRDIEAINAKLMEKKGN